MSSSAHTMRFLRSLSTARQGRAVFFVVVLGLFAGWLHAEGLVLQPVDKNLDEERAALVAFFDVLAKSPAGAGSDFHDSAGYGMEAPPVQVSQDKVHERPHHRFVRQGLDWASAGSTPYKKDMTLDAMTTLCATAAQSVGTATQGQQAAALNTYGTNLASNSDPQLQQAGTLMQSESSAVAAGDQTSAESYAASVQSLPQASLVGYSPTTSDTTWGQAMGQVGQQALASAAGSLSSAAMSALVSGLTSYFGGGSGSNSSAWSSIAANLAASLAKGAVNGTNSANSMAGNAGGIGIGSVGSMMGGLSGGNSLAGPSAVGGGLAGALNAPTGAANIGVQNNAGAAATGALPGSTH